MRFLKESYNDKYVITYEKNNRQWFWNGVLDINKAELYSKEQAENILNELIAQNNAAIKYYLNKIDKDGNASLYNMFIEEYQEFIDTAKIKKVNISVNLSESVNKLQNIRIPNYYNTWSAIDSLTVRIGDEAPVTYYLMENDRYGDETFYLVVTEDLKTIYETFDDIETCLIDEEILWEHLDLDEALGLNETIKSINLSKSAVVNYIMNDFELNDEFSNDFDLYDTDDEEVDKIINEIDLTSLIDWIANQGEEELEKFCNEFDLDYEHFSDYGPVNDMDLKESVAIENEITLHYEDLPITYQYNHTIDYWDGRQWEEKDINIDWDYKVAKEDILDAIIDEVADEMHEKFVDKEDFSDSEITKYFNDNFDRLFKTYNKQILDYFKDEAIEDAEENYEADYSGYYEEDNYDPDMWG